MSYEKFAVEHGYQARNCRMCQKSFTPPRTPGKLSVDGNHKTHCPECRRIIKDATDNLASSSDTPVLHSGPGAPMRQVVFDLETFSLTRGWGVTLVASFLIHGDPEGPKYITLRNRDTKSWKKGIRSSDEEIATEIFSILSRCHVAYAHNGVNFDRKWLKTVAIRYGLTMPRLKIVDPCKIAWGNYAFGSNSLDAISDFLGLGEKKMHVSADVWRRALMDDDAECWDILAQRCQSDVRILNDLASRFTGDLGLIDYQGSWRG